MKKIILMPITIAFIIVFTQSMCTKEFLCESEDNQINYRNGFVISYNETHEQPNWVTYVLKPSDLTCHTKASRNDEFKEDTKITTGSATIDDYKNSGYDRGHLKPSADESCDQEQMDETFLMSNMSPQKPDFNRGIWKHLETYTRELALKNDSIRVYTGGILNKPMGFIGKNKVTVPRSYYKILYVFKNGNAKVLAYLIPNQKSTLPYDNFITQVNKIQLETKIIFPNPYDKNKLPKVFCK